MTFAQGPIDELCRESQHLAGVLQRHRSYHHQERATMFLVQHVPPAPVSPRLAHGRLLMGSVATDRSWIDTGHQSLSSALAALGRVAWGYMHTLS